MLNFCKGELGDSMTGSTFLDSIIAHYRKDAFYVSELKSAEFVGEIFETVLYGRIVVWEPTFKYYVSATEARRLFECMKRYPHELPEHTQRYITQDLLYGVSIGCTHLVRSGFAKSSCDDLVYRIPDTSPVIRRIWIDLPPEVQKQTIWVSVATSMQYAVLHHSAREFGSPYRGQDQVMLDLELMTVQEETRLYIHVPEECEKYMQTIELDIEHVFLGPALHDRMQIDKYNSIPIPLVHTPIFTTARTA